VNDGGDCWVPSDKVIIPLVPTEIDQTDSKNEFYVYPNPSTGNIKIFYYGPSIGKTIIRICNPEGQIIRELEIINNDFYLSEGMELSGFSPGMYIIELFNNQIIMKTRLMVL
jgi:hypothetical protein